MRSMTGFGEAAGDNGRHAVTVALRAVNHRFLDVQTRLPEELRASEAALRELLARDLARGRIEVRVDVQPLVERAARVALHLGAIRAAHAAVHQLVEAGLVESGLSAGDLLRLPDAFRVEVDREAWDAADDALLLSVAGEALRRLIAAREAEGTNLAASLLARLSGLEQLVDRLAALSGPVREELAAGLSRRVAELVGDRELDPSRLAQEVALLADKSDVSEEIDRLRAHLDHFRTVCADAGATGKRLDFLTQEVFRELNTLGAKCRNAEMTRTVLDAKVVCEQLREQVQNVE
jgi:uncharacterized protein (TIGR00255 family)